MSCKFRIVIVELLHIWVEASCADHESKQKTLSNNKVVRRLRITGIDKLFVGWITSPPPLFGDPHPHTSSMFLPTVGPALSLRPLPMAPFLPSVTLTLFTLDCE